MYTIQRDPAPSVSRPSNGLGVLLAPAFWLFGAALVLALSRTEDGGVQIGLLGFMVLPAFVLGATRSRWQVPYLLCAWAFGPEVRRVADWIGGEYQTVSVLSLVPLLATLSLLLPMWRTRVRLTGPLRAATLCLCVAYVYGAIVGAARNGFFVALYECATYVVPFLLVLYAASRPANPRERDQWLRALSVVATLVAAYGWVQIIFVPPWDKFWMERSGLAVGLPAPFQFRLFSTMNSAGPAALMLAMGLGPMLLERRWRGFFGWAGVIVVASALAFSQVRSAWLLALVVIGVYVLLSPARRRLNTALAVGFLGVALLLAGPFLPGWELVSDRAATLQNIQEDGSFQGRLATGGTAVASVLVNPLGYGMGFAGTATKLLGANPNTSRRDAVDNTETGILNLLQTFGLLGGVALFAAIGFLFAATGPPRPSRTPADFAAQNGAPGLIPLARTALVCCLVGLLFGNVLPGVAGFLTWLLFSVAMGPAPSPRPSLSAAPHTRTKERPSLP